MKKLFILSFLWILSIYTSVAQGNLKLWYRQPAAKGWTSALPIGNGRLAAMIYGNPERDIIKLNEATVWSGSPHRNDDPQLLAVLPEVRRLIFEGKQKEAHQLIEKTISFKTKSNGMSYQPVGNLFLDFKGHENPSDYYRELDLATAKTLTTYKVNGVSFKREVIASTPEQLWSIGAMFPQVGLWVGK